MSKVNLDLLIRKYTEGQISREEFLYFHALLSKNKLDGVSFDASIDNFLAQKNAQSKANLPKQNAQRKALQQKIQQSQRTVRRPATNNAYTAQTRQQQNVGINIHQPIATKAKPHQLFGKVTKQIVGVVTAMGIIIPFISGYFFTKPNNNHSSNISRDADNKYSPLTPNLGELEIRANLLSRSQLWEREAIDEFTKLWAQLDKQDKLNAQKSLWFRQFTLTMSIQLTKQRSMANDGNVTAAYNERSIQKLADLIRDFKESRETSRIAKDSHDTSNTETSKTASRSLSALTSGREPSKISTNFDYDRSDIDQVIDQFIYSYETGNAQSLSKILNDGASTDQKNFASKTLRMFNNTFNTTSGRTLQISSLSWKLDKAYAFGTGYYRATLNNNDNSQKLISANIAIKLVKSGNQLLISDIRFSNVETSSGPTVSTIARNKGSDTTSKSRPKTAKVSTPPAPVVAERSTQVVTEPAIPKPATARPSTPTVKTVQEVVKRPTNVELDELITRYVDSYQTGDVDELMRLFSTATWTAAVSGIVEMRDHYETIFDETATRSINVDKIKWIYKNNKAMGTGDLQISSVRKDGTRENAKGKIRLVVERKDDIALISHLYHITN